MVQIFRALAIIAVVMIHTTPLGSWQVLCRPFINFSVASFLFLSGYLTKIENDNWHTFYKKRIIRVLIPYIIWTILYTLVSRHLGRLPQNLLTAKAAGPMYYIFVYIQFVLLTPFLGRLAKSKYHLLGYFVAPVSVLVFKYYWLLTGNNLNSYISLIWSDACLGWFTFYYLGLALGNRIIKKQYSLKVLLMSYIVSILLQIAEGYWWLSIGETNCGTQIKLSSFLTSSLFLLITYTILIDGRYGIKNRYLRIIGDYSFGIYLCHIMVKNLLRCFVPYFQSIPYPINSVIILLISLCCCYFGDKICSDKLSRWIGLK
ncbi:MAG: acyltransferase [Prevotella sp.]|nr:acyltransferase [Prevotella sp.]